LNGTGVRQAILSFQGVLDLAPADFVRRNSRQERSSRALFTLNVADRTFALLVVVHEVGEKLAYEGPFGLYKGGWNHAALRELLIDYYAAVRRCPDTEFLERSYTIALPD